MLEAAFLTVRRMTVTERCSSDSSAGQAIESLELLVESSEKRVRRHTTLVRLEEADLKAVALPMNDFMLRVCMAATCTSSSAPLSRC